MFPSRTKTRRGTARLLLATGAAGLLTAGVLVSPASAHVTVSSPDAAGGGYGKLVFRVPTESANASTKRLTVHLPTGMPFASVSAKPKVGWSVRTQETKLPKTVKTSDLTLTKAITTITWQAKDDQAAIPPGAFDEFELSVGPFPKKGGTLVATATQFYTDGSVVRWDQKTKASGGEAEHPAPTLEVASAGAAASATPSSEPAKATAATGSDVPARVLGAVAVVLALGALALSVRRRRSSGEGAAR
ncbi:MAG: YcnI family protein [Streptosporangiales bacterium]